MLDLIYDRTQFDVANRTKKGYYNSDDMNRVSAAVDYLAEWFSRLGYTVPGHVKGPVWTKQSIPSKSQMEQYRLNVSGLRDTIAVLASTPQTPSTMEKLGFSGANDLEKILADVEETIMWMECIFQRSGVWISDGVLHPRDMYYDWAVVQLPEQVGALVYTGAEQSPDWGPDSDKYDVLSGGSAINAGSYTAAIKPKEGYKWPDGPVAAKEFPWTIGKAHGVIALVPPSLTMAKANWLTQVAVQYNGDGALSANVNNGNVSATLTGETVTLMSIAIGSSVLSVSAAEGQNYLAAGPVECPITIEDVIQTAPAAGVYESDAARNIADPYR